MNRKRIGILLVILAIVIGTVAVIMCFVGDQEPEKEETKVEKETEKEIVTLPEQEETEEPEEPEEAEGAPEKNVYIEQVQMELIGLSEETEACIPDREAFDYQIKEWLYEHDKDNETIQSLNTVTYYYDQNCCEFMLQTEDHQVFCIRQDLKEDK
jgi:hypothetical protein